MAMRKPGPYAPLSAHYADDERIMEAGEDAELLYVRMLAYAARTPTTEGWISDAVIQSRLGIIPRYDGSGMVPGTDAGSRAGKLRETGLITRDGNGYRITSWLRWNKSAAEMGKERDRDRKRKKPTTSKDDGNDAGSRAGTDTGVPAFSVGQKQNTETETETDQKQSTRKRETYPDGFEQFWAVYPKNADKRTAFKAWERAVKRADEFTVKAGAEAYRDDPNRDDRFTKNAATWLNADAWDNAPLIPRGSVSRDQQVNDTAMAVLGAVSGEQWALEG